jgi:hypothetical protein
MVHISTGEIEKLPDLVGAKAGHSIHFSKDENVAYIIGGFNKDNETLSSCEQLQILN